MFRSLIYCNTNRLYEYMSLLKKKKEIKFTDVVQTNQSSINGELKFLGGSKQHTINLTGQIYDNLLYDYNEFEDLLKKQKDYFFDFVESANIYDISTVNSPSIIKFESTLVIPSEFDVIQLIEKFKPYLINSIGNDMAEDEKNAFQNFFSANELKIPTFMQIEDEKLYSKLSSDFLMVPYTDLEEYERTEVIILAKIKSHKQTNKETIIYDPLKDFIQLNREMRRSMNDTRPKELAPIFTNENYTDIEVIAVYQ